MGASLKGSFVFLLACYDDDLYPNFNSLYGCDFYVPEVKHEKVPDGFHWNVGLEIKRTIKNYLKTD